MMVPEKVVCKECNVHIKITVDIKVCSRCSQTLCVEHQKIENHGCYYSAPQKQVAELPLGEKFETTFDDTAVIERLAKSTYPDETSAFRELKVNAHSHGCLVAMEKGFLTKNGDEPYVIVYLDALSRKLTITDVGGMGMSKRLVRDVLSCVGKSGNFDSSKAGQMGMGFYAVLKLASVVIIESYSRETDERQCLIMRDGKYWQEIQQAPENQLTDYGTRLTITLYPEPEVAAENHKARTSEIQELLESDDLTPEKEMTLNAELKLLENEPDSVSIEKLLKLIKPLTDHSGVTTKVIMEHDTKEYSEGETILEPITPADYVNVEEAYDDEYSIDTQYITIDNENYSLHIGLGSKEGYKGQRKHVELLVGVPIKSNVNIPRFTTWRLNIKNERKFRPLASREELLSSSTTRLQSLIDKDLERIFSQIDARDIESYKNSKDKIIIKHATKMGVHELLPHHTYELHKHLSMPCQELEIDGIRHEKILMEFIDNWDNTVYVKSNNKNQRHAILTLNPNNQVLILSRKDSYFYEHAEILESLDIQFAKDYLKANRSKISKVARDSLEYEIAAHSGNDTKWVGIEDIIENPDGYVMCGENFKQIMRTWCKGVCWIKDTARLRKEIANYTKGWEYSVKIKTYEQLIDSLDNVQYDSTIGKISIKDISEQEDHTLNYYIGNLDKVAHLNEKYLKLDGFILFLDDIDSLYNIKYVLGVRYTKKSFDIYNPMTQIISNIINDKLSGYDDKNIVYQMDSLISNGEMTKIDDIQRVLKRLQGFKSVEILGKILYAYRIQIKSNAYSIETNADTLVTEEEFFNKMTPILKDFVELKNPFDRYEQLIDMYKTMFKAGMPNTLLEYIKERMSQTRKAFNKYAVSKLIRASFPVAKVKIYKSNKMEIVFDAKVTNITKALMGNICDTANNNITKFQSIRKVGKRLKLVLTN